MKALYSKGAPDQSRNRVLEVVQEVYGRPLTDLEREWWAFLDAR
jgi:hypothetical protein